MGEEPHCMRGGSKCHELLECTSVATGQVWEIGAHLKGQYKHPSIYRRVGARDHPHSLGTKFDLQVGLIPNQILESDRLWIGPGIVVH